MPDHLVTIETYRFPPEAEFAKTLLASEGITAFLSDIEVVKMDWLLGNAIGDVKLQVPSQDAERAIAVLKNQAPRRDSHLATDRTPDGDYCLSCNAPLPSGQAICPSCGWTYSEPFDTNLQKDNLEDDVSEESPVRPSDQPDEPGPLASLLQAKKPILLLAILPTAIVLLIYVAFLLSRIIDYIRSMFSE